MARRGEFWEGAFGENPGESGLGTRVPALGSGNPVRPVRPGLPSPKRPTFRPDPKGRRFFDVVRKWGIVAMLRDEPKNRRRDFDA
jgi:hypothetical protein